MQQHCSSDVTMTLQAMEGSSDSANVTESHVCKFSQVFSSFLRFSQVFPGPEAAKAAMADQQSRCSLHNLRLMRRDDRREFQIDAGSSPVAVT